MQRLVKSFLLGTAFIAAAANAGTINGIFWSVPAATADNVPTLGNTPGPSATEWGTFTASAIQFSGDSNYSLGGFLNSYGAASNIVYMNGATASTSLTDVLFEFAGTALFTTGQAFNVVHDDGVNMYVNGSLVLGVPGPTAPTLNTYTYMGPSGNQSFDFIYANGPPTQADFQTTLTANLTSGAPEPSAGWLFLAGLSAVWTLGRATRLRRH